jgi:hypothetical protein
MRGVITTVYGDRVEVDIIDNTVRGSVVHQLIAGARATGEQIHIDTGGRFPTYWVSVTTAENSGLINVADPVPPAGIVEPPRTGKGSGREAWLEFLDAQRVSVPRLGVTRDQLIALWDERKGLPRHFFEES